MNLNHLAVFHAVAEEGSISRGAARLFISQPAVSKQLAELERSLNAPLFVRLPKGVRLTEAGEILHGFARRLFALESEAEAALAELQGLRRGRLAVGASTTIGAYLLPGILTAFHRRYPGIELHLETANTETIQRLLIDGLLDVGLTEGFVGSDDLEAEVFIEDELVAIAAPDHPILADAPVTLERFCLEPFVVRERGSGMRAVVDHALEERGRAVQAAMTLGSTEAIKRAVAIGAGVAIVSGLTIGLEREAGRLAVVEVRDLLLRRPLYRLRVRGKPESRAVRAFHERMDRSLRSRSWKSYQLIG